MAKTLRKTHGLSYTRHFYLGDPKKSVATSLKWQTRDLELRNSRGEVYFAMKKARAPAFWSPLAVEIAASKYFRKRGVPKGFGDGKGSENSVEDMVTRVTESIESFAKARGYFKDPASARAFRQDLEWLLYHQRGSFNSPVWFNAGLHHRYGLTSDSRSYIWDFKTRDVRLSQEALERPQVSACFIQKVDDNLDSIFDLVRNEARIFKFGSGSGTNFSHLRSRFEKLAGGGTSSGVLSFLEVLDRSAGSVKSGGTTRRAAKMVILDVDHPEIEEFIDWKAREEKKAKALIQAGYDAHFEGEAYRTVSGQNSNNSVRVTDAFMKAVEKDGVWKLRDRLSGKAVREVKARELWTRIATAAWECADPGLQFHDIINKWHTCGKTAPIRGSNPCSEYLFIDDSACNLASLNLLKFVDEDLNFDLASFRAAARCFFLAQEILVDLASYPTEGIAQNSHDYRTLGLGFTGFGAFLMRRGIAYDAPEARHWGAVLTALLTGYAYELSGEVAKGVGPFAGWKKNKLEMAGVMKRHRQAVNGIGAAGLPAELKAEARAVWDRNLEFAAKTGFRNAQATVIAPTGTISFIMDSETTGIEPEYALVRFKNLAGGGVIRLTSPSVEAALRRWNLDEDRIVRVLAWADEKGSLSDCPELTPQQRAVFRTALEISPDAHIEMMAAVQPFVSGAISKTVNLPHEASIAEIERLYRRAWDLGLKAVAIYRDQSKGFQPLVVKAKEEVADRLEANDASPVQATLGVKADEDAGRWRPASPVLPLDMPRCFECGTQTELSGGCFRCPNCGTVIGCS
ncbi:MAG: vitamin B12-dependent ribonucleotide reductase [Bdellovibrionaceae bacterium]|nr:vitamin B12-dependent ribonucleotide reductase [Pseudobdellovibrionaceae bacterium]